MGSGMIRVDFGGCCGCLVMCFFIIVAVFFGIVLGMDA